MAQSSLRFWLKVSRAQVLPVMVLPVMIGASGAFAFTQSFHLGLFLITLIGALSAHLFSNMINDLWDFKNGVDQAAEESAASISTNSRVLPNGQVNIRTFALVTWGYFAIALLAGISLSVIVGWPVLLFAVIGGLIAYFYVAPPLKFGYRGKGYSELAIFLAFGVLPVTGTYYVLTESLHIEAFLISIPIGLLTTLILYNHHFLHWEADLNAGKKTLVVIFGEKKAINFSKFLAGLSYLSLLFLVVGQVLPWYALIALLSAYPLFKTYGTLSAKNESKQYAVLMGASLKATIRTGLVMTLSLIISGIITM
ncbi:prenyltransferase [Geomicrobium sp. JCM 19038]|uniref:prenyltransferase n=1 Tax=Geomicrobium sp. JCM 19038 TaxID=1460635 RepID=UPI00045F25CF|nr:prenyltransferase [Geomicrobium sp. JCM 19038]GAK07296.1 1,4-dihydroxy-2-naphthoate octaprenyltransferase [Geomicrobium sp. JCM 19038]